MAEHPTTPTSTDPVEGTTSIVVVGHLTVDPPSRDAYLLTCAPVVRAARSTSGCIDFAIGPDLVDPGRINIYERWTGRRALDAFREQGPDEEQAAALTSVRIEELRAEPV